MENTFQCTIKITMSEYDSWEGTLRFEDTDYHFRSEIELLRLLEELLSKSLPDST